MCMANYDYKELLERAYKQLPKEAIKKDERWEMPSLTSVISGNVTSIKNFVDACKHIRREPKEVMKYLVKELGTQWFIESNALILTGKFNNKTINEKFKRYINHYVLCPICKKPDTKLIKIDRILFIKCEACGARNPVK